MHESTTEVGELANVLLSFPMLTTFSVSPSTFDTSASTLGSAMTTIRGSNNGRAFSFDITPNGCSRIFTCFFNISSTIGEMGGTTFLHRLLREEMYCDTDPPSVRICSVLTTGAANL